MSNVSWICYVCKKSFKNRNKNKHTESMYHKQAIKDYEYINGPIIGDTETCCSIIINIQMIDKYRELLNEYLIADITDIIIAYMWAKN